MVPQIVPPEDDSEEEDMQTSVTPQPPVFDISFYNKHASLVIKVCHNP